MNEEMTKCTGHSKRLVDWSSPWYSDVKAQVIVTLLSVVSTRGMNIIFKFSMLSSIHSLRSVPSLWLWRPLHTVNIIWSLMKLENSRDWLQLWLGWAAVPGSGPGAAAWKLSSARLASWNSFQGVAVTWWPTWYQSSRQFLPPWKSIRRTF